MEDHAECILVLIGATPEGKKELVGFQVGVRESTQSWRELLVEIKRRGLSIPPRIAVGDGALGFWKALDELFPGTYHQRCWLHKAANVLNKVPKSVQPGMKAALREIYLAPTRAQAEVAVDLFEHAYGARYPKVVECVRKDQRASISERSLQRAARCQKLPFIRHLSLRCPRPAGSRRTVRRREAGRCRRQPPACASTADARAAHRQAPSRCWWE